MEDFDKLVELHQEGKINTVEFINLQEDRKEEYKEWREEFQKEENENTAKEFIAYLDEYVMNHQNNEM